VRIDGTVPINAEWEYHENGIWKAVLDMDAVSIKGTRELPKVLYIVPWKSTRLGSLVAGAGSDSFASDWTAVDRSVFRRQVHYYDLLYPAGGSPGVR